MNENQTYFQKYLIDQLNEIRKTQTDLQVSFGKLTTRIDISEKDRRTKTKKTAALTSLIATGVLNIIAVILSKVL